MKWSLKTHRFDFRRVVDSQARTRVTLVQMCCTACVAGQRSWCHKELLSSGAASGRTRRRYQLGNRTTSPCVCPLHDLVRVRPRRDVLPVETDDPASRTARPDRGTGGPEGRLASSGRATTAASAFRARRHPSLHRKHYGDTSSRRQPRRQPFLTSPKHGMTMMRPLKEADGF